MGAFDDYRQDREVIAATDHRLVVAVNERGRGKASGAEVVRTTYTGSGTCKTAGRSGSPFTGRARKPSMPLGCGS